jgi:hypothetical protein
MVWIQELMQESQTLLASEERQPLRKVAFKKEKEKGYKPLHQ